MDTRKRGPRANIVRGFNTIFDVRLTPGFLYGAYICKKTGCRLFIEDKGFSIGTSVKLCVMDKAKKEAANRIVLDF